MTTREKGAIAALVLAAPVFFILNEPRTAPATTAPSTSLVSTLNSSSQLTVGDIKFARGQYGNVLVVGTVKNPTSKQFSYAQVEINLYDKEGNQIGSTLANINNLEPGGTWKFEAPIINEDKVETAKVKGITAF